MTTRLETLENAVKALYNAHDPGRDGWSDWLLDNHVIVVADYASELAKKYNVNEELSRTAALLHDIADTKMSRMADNHETESLNIARKLMQDADFSQEEIELVVDDAIRFHSCHGDERPKSKEGQILSTADSMAHLKTGFYVYATWAFGKDRTLEELRAWVLKKIDRDLNNKILFDDEKRDAQADYDMIKELFSRS